MRWDIKAIYQNGAENVPHFKPVISLYHVTTRTRCPRLHDLGDSLIILYRESPSIVSFVCSSKQAFPPSCVSQSSEAQLLKARSELASHVHLPVLVPVPSLCGPPPTGQMCFLWMAPPLENALSFRWGRWRGSQCLVTSGQLKSNV